jgi:hypothetical protein
MTGSSVLKKFRKKKWKPLWGKSNKQINYLMGNGEMAQLFLHFSIE